MATVKKIKKAQAGKSVKPTADSSAYYKKEMMDNYEAAARNMSSPKYSESAFKRAKQSSSDLDRQSKKGKPGYDANGFPLKKQKMGGKTVKAKKGGSFPDLNKDGKITKADILKGRGVIAKKGMKVEKAQVGTTIKQSNANTLKEIAAREKRIATRDSINQAKSYTNKRANKVIGKNKMGGKVKKCAYGCK